MLRGLILQYQNESVSIITEESQLKKQTEIFIK